MSPRLRRLAWLFLVAASGCEEEVKPPPVFNAIDLSLQCPSGKVGWDFTTGGNDTDLVPASFGTQVKVDTATVTCISPGATPSAQAISTVVDLTSSFRAECDNALRCDRQLVNPTDPQLPSTCEPGVVTVRYRCGNEPTVYDISRRFMGLTSRFPDILEETRPILATDKIQLSCGEVITMKGSSVPNHPLDYSKLLSCNGKRRCYSDNRYDLGVDMNRRPSPTRYFYTCGSSNAVREASVPYPRPPGQSGAIDFSCGDDIGQTGVERNGAIFMKDLTYSNGPAPNATLIERLKQEFNTRCNGRRQCEVPLSDADRQALLRLEPNFDGAFTAEYWCGDSRVFADKKHFTLSELLGLLPGKGDQTFKLQCGGRLRIVGDVAPWVARDCPPGATVCSLPPSERTTTVTFFCDNVPGTAQNRAGLAQTSEINFSLGRTRNLECPLVSKGGGIEITSFSGERPSIDAIALCNNKTNCLIPVLNSEYARAGYQYHYKCSGTGENKDAPVQTLAGKQVWFLDCAPKPRVTEISGCITAPSSRLACLNAPSAGCTVALADPANAETIRACTTPIHVKWMCGNDTTVYSRQIAPGSLGPSLSPDGGSYGADGGSLFNYTVECPYDPTPRTPAANKACVPIFCPNRTKRDARLECVPDGTISVYPFLNSFPVLRDPNTMLEVAEIKEGFPYVKTLGVFYGGPPLTASHAGTLWAYDVFKRKDGTGGEVFGFRCIVSTASMKWTNGSFAAFGDWESREASALPSNCFNAPYGDTNSSWYHGSASIGVNEQVFRNQFDVVRTMVVSSLDTKGRAIDSFRFAPNPIGFFYLANTGYVNQLGYFGQTSNFISQRPFRFVESRQIELQAGLGHLDSVTMDIAPATLKSPPNLQMNFRWRMLGDSPMHPHSPNTRLLGTQQTNLRSLNLRAVLEIAKEDPAFPNKWVPQNSAVVGTVGIGGGNAQEKVDRLSPKLSPDLIKRMMSVRGTGPGQRPDGWMATNLEVNAVFKARACIDFDGIARAPGQTDIDNKFISANVGGTTYRLGVTTRCSPEVPFVVTRDLFPKAVLPVADAEKDMEQGKDTAQGGGRVNSNTAQATQQSCRRQCMVASDCGAGGVCDRPTAAVGSCAATSLNVQCQGAYRSGGTSGGSVGFGQSVFSAQNSSSTASAGTAAGNPNARSRTSVELMSFNVLEADDGADAMPVMNSSTKRELKMTLGRLWSSVVAISQAMAKNAKRANPKPVKPWWKPSVSSRGEPAISFGVSVETILLVGPIAIVGEFYGAVTLGFDVALTFTSDTQTAETMNNPAYPCLGTTRCVQLVTTPKHFEAANQDCHLKGGRLAEPRSAAALSNIRMAAAGNAVWIGAQASYLFADPSCTELIDTDPIPGLTEANLQTRLAECRNAITQYQWVAGNQRIGNFDSNGRVVNDFSGNHGFGQLNTVANTAAPLTTGVLMTANGSLEGHRTRTQVGDLMLPGALRVAPYVCEFDPAHRYVEGSIKLEPEVNLSYGVGAELCWPTSVVGGCLVGEFKYVTAGIKVEVGRQAFQIYDTATSVRPSKVIGESGTSGKWEIAFLRGEAKGEIRLLFVSKEFPIARYDGVFQIEGDLWNDMNRFRR